MKYKYLDYNSRVNELKETVAPLKDILFLDGNSITYKGKVFVGCSGWYDGSYYYKLAGMYSTNILDHWKSYLNDSKLIPNLTDFYPLWEQELKKIKASLQSKPDVMITHFSPVSEGINFDGDLKTDKGSGYYCFDGLHLTEEIHSPKFWVHGHIHKSKIFKIYGCTYLRNPIGYPGENNFEVKYFEV